MMDRSFSPSSTPVSLALAAGAIKGKLTKGEIQSDEKNISHPLEAAEARSHFPTVQTNTKTNHSAATPAHRALLAALKRQ